MTTDPGEPTLTIGRLQRAVADEFPDCTISKIRFLQAQGLLDPQRSPAGYRRYAASDVERLQFVLRAQRDHFWPLKVIREALEARDRGLVPDLDAPGARAAVPQDSFPATDPPARADELRLGRDEVAAAAEMSQADLDALVEAGLVRADPDGWFSRDDLEVARAARGLAAYGIGPRHLRSFRAGADREVGLVEQSLSSRRGTERASAAEEVTSLLLALHAALVRGGVRRAVD